MTENDFKTRFNNHKLSFRNRDHSRDPARDTVLSKYVWELKDNDMTYDIKWCIIRRANASTKETRHAALLCLSEKLGILAVRDTVPVSYTHLTLPTNREV